jgi:Holliday junction resolvase RusA-like endonuclease
LAPLSENRAKTVRGGRIYASKDKKIFQKSAYVLLLQIKNVKTYPKMILYLRWGFKNCDGSDWDNPIKMFQDVLAKRFKFNDKQVHLALIHKVQTDKPFIEFKIEEYKGKSW